MERTYLEYTKRRGFNKNSIDGVSGKDSLKNIVREEKVCRAVRAIRLDEAPVEVWKTLKDM